MPEYILSIALVTRNRPDLLAKCLESLNQQPHLWFEIVISDDSADEQFISQNKSISDKYSTRYLTGPRKGLYANRNYVAKNCRGTHIRTMDDDHTFPEDHFKICMDKIKEDPDSIWTIGEYNHTDMALGLPNPPHPIPSEIHPRGFSVEPKDSQNSRAIACGASIYPKNIIDLNILNNEDFKFGSNYLEYGSRLKYLGFRIRHIPETYVIHDFNLETRSFDNEIELMNSNIYAMMCLSFVYEPTIKNKLFTLSRLASLLYMDYKTFKPIIIENRKKVKMLRNSIQQFRRLNHN